MLYRHAPTYRDFFLNFYLIKLKTKLKASVKTKTRLRYKVLKFSNTIYTMIFEGYSWAMAALRYKNRPIDHNPID